MISTMRLRCSGVRLPARSAEGHAEVLDGAHDLRIALGGAGRGADGGHALENVIDRGAVVFELLLPFLGDGVELACALGGDGGQAGLLEEGEHGVDDAGAGGVGAAELLFDGLDQFVAVAGLLGDEVEEEVAEVVGAEDPAGSATTPEGALSFSEGKGAASPVVTFLTAAVASGGSAVFFEVFVWVSHVCSIKIYL